MIHPRPFRTQLSGRTIFKLLNSKDIKKDLIDLLDNRVNAQRKHLNIFKKTLNLYKNETPKKP